MTLNKAKKTALTPQQLLTNPTRLVVSVSQAAVCLGIAKSTAHNAYRDTGFLTTGVPVLRIGKRCVVATAHLRAVLGLDDPHPVLFFSPVDEMTPDTQLSL